MIFQRPVYSVHVRYYLSVCVWIALAVNVSIAAVAFASAKQAELLTGVKELPDLGHMLLPRIPVYVPDVCVFLVFAAVVARGHMPSLPYAKTVSSVYVIRAAVMCSTFYPKTNHVTYYGPSGDLMFSGHTVAFWAGADLLFSSRDRWWNPREFVCRAVMPMLLVASRQHYTADVLVSMTIMMFIPHRQTCRHVWGI